MTVDWGRGRYETTAETLVPGAETAVAIAAIRAGERVVDIGCGTGNATLLAAAGGATVMGVDPSPRLMDVARTRAAERGLSIEFRAGTAADLPLDDASVDLALSVFAVIFAPDPAAAAAEISRVLTPAGRAVITAWVPDGAFGEVTRLSMRIVRETLGMPEPPAPFPWHEQQAVSDLFAPYGFTVSTTTHPIAFTAESPEAAYDMGQDSPIAVANRSALESAGRGEQVDRIRAEAIEILRQRNQDPLACRVTSVYAVHLIERRRP